MQCSRFRDGPLGRCLFYRRRHNFRKTALVQTGSKMFQKTGSEHEINDSRKLYDCSFFFACVRVARRTFSKLCPEALLCFLASFSTNIPKLVQNKNTSGFCPRFLNSIEIFLSFLVTLCARFRLFVTLHFFFIISVF